MTNAEFYKDRRVLVTGGKGFIGSALCDALRGLGAVVYPFDKRDRGPDVTEFGNVGDAFTDFSPQLVFHLAACTEVGRSFGDPRKCYATNFLGTLNVLDQCRHHGRVPIVVASSDKAYGNWMPPYGEAAFNALGGASDPYSASKRHTDLLAQEYAALYNLPVRVARPCNVYGPGQKNETTLITNTILRLLRGEPVVIYDGAGSVLREWLYVDDMVEAYLLLGADAASEGDTAYNIGSRQVAKVDEIVARLHEIIRCEWRWKNEPGPASQTRDQYLDSTRFRKRFPGWTARTLQDGLRTTVDWYKENYATYDPDRNERPAAKPEN